MQSYQREATFPSTIAVLPAILAFVEEACAAACVTPALLFDLQLAVEEACSNVIQHAYRGQHGVFHLTFTAENGAVTITVHDQGQPFEPQAVARPDPNLPLKEWPIGGLGLHLMYQLMDEVRFTFDASGNTLRLVKRDAIAENAAACSERSDLA